MQLFQNKLTCEIKYININNQITKHDGNSNFSNLLKLCTVVPCLNHLVCLPFIGCSHKSFNVQKYPLLMPTVLEIAVYSLVAEMKTVIKTNVPPTFPVGLAQQFLQFMGIDLLILFKNKNVVNLQSYFK